MSQNLIQMVESVCDALISQSDYLNELDSVMGDGEHGSNIKKCFSLIKAQLPQWSQQKDSEMLGSIGMKLLSAGGGTATTLMGYALMRLSTHLIDKNMSDEKILSVALQETLIEVQNRSKAQIGDKTLMDALIPGIEAFREAVDAGEPISGCFKKCAEQAELGAEKTKELIAHRGRGLYVGERGIGVPDPGATSISIIAKTICENINQ